jgi:hypothetical protein
MHEKARFARKLSATRAFSFVLFDIKVKIGIGMATLYDKHELYFMNKFSVHLCYRQFPRK